MRVLVTGNLGYIGTVLVPLLKKRGHAVTGCDSDLFAACTFDGELEPVETIRKDVRDIEIEDLEGIEAVIHLAGLSNDPLGDYRPELTFEINRDASVRLSELAKKAGVSRFLFASSCSNYGASGGDFIDENAPFRPVTPYGESKVAVEQELAHLADDTFSPTYIRASTAYGLSPRLRFDLVVNNLTAWAVTTNQVHLKSDGLPWRPIIHVEDICNAYIASLEADRGLIHEGAFNVGLTTENYQIRDIAKIVHEEVEGSEIGFAEGAGPDKRSYRVDCNHIATTLHNFKPQWTCRRGVRQLIEAYRRANLTLEEFEGPKYKRIDHVLKLIEEGVLDSSLRRLQ